MHQWSSQSLGHSIEVGRQSSSFIFDRTDDRSQDRSASATSNQLTDDSADAQISSLCGFRDGWNQRCHNLSEETASDRACYRIADLAEIEFW